MEKSNTSVEKKKTTAKYVNTKKFLNAIANLPGQTLSFSKAPLHHINEQQQKLKLLRIYYNNGMNYIKALEKENSLDPEKCELLKNELKKAFGLAKSKIIITRFTKKRYPHIVKKIYSNLY